MLTDRELVGRIGERDRAALRGLFERHYQGLCALTLRITLDAEVASQVVDDTFITVWRDAPRSRGTNVAIWIAGIAYRKAVKAAKRRARTPVVAAEPSDRREPGSDLERSLAALTPEQRAVLELTYGAGYSLEEIASILRCPESAVKSRMLQARKKLREALEA